MNKKLLKYFNNDEFRASTWLNKYAARNDKGEIIEKTPDDMHNRLSREFSRIESLYDYDVNSPEVKKNLSNLGLIASKLDHELIYLLFSDFKYIIPAGSVMAILGLNLPSSISNCFVIASAEDSINGINKTSTEQQNLMKRRGGVGHDISTIRPRGAKVNNSANTSSGVVPFMNLYSEATNTIAQEGRRGALMLSISIDHPDSPEFIKSKQDLTKITGANISVKVTDKFMNAVINDEDYILRYPIDAEFKEINNPDPNTPYNKLNVIESDGEIIGYTKKIRAKDLWDDLMYCAWNTAEPGIIFEDRMINYAPDGVYDKYKFISTNPCGEIPMQAYDSCRLIHMNLLSVVSNPYTPNASINEELLYKIAYYTTVLADDMIDLEIEAIDRILDKINLDNNKDEAETWIKIKENAISGRRAGAGFTALADAIAALGYKFDSPKGIKSIENIMKIIFEAQLTANIDLAIKRGPFPDWNPEIEKKGNDWYDFVKEEFPDLYNKMMKFGRRNISFSTVAPTGTVSIMAGTSSGIEPVFMPFYQRFRKCMKDTDRVDFTDAVGEKYTSFVVVHPAFNEWASEYYMEYTDEWELSEWEDAYEESPWYKSTAPDINWRKRVEIQGIIQKYTTHSISSTINLDNDVTKEEIADIYIEAWKNGNKGQTIYRDGCRDGILNKISDNDTNSDENKNSFTECCEAPKRPYELEADYYQIKVNGELFSIVVGLYNNKPYEVFAFKPKINVKIEPHKGIITKIEKNHYQFNSDLLEIENLELTAESEVERATTLFASMLLRHGVSIRYIIKTARKINPIISSFSSALCRILSRYMNDVTETGEKCPECGGKIIHEAGCIRCLDCDYSKCL